jgi:hypothetical protein
MRLDSGRIVIRVDDRGAAYPVRVDPFLQQAERRLGDGVPGDVFAVVAVSGDTLVVGAPGRAVGANQAQGAVYVFQRPVSGWAKAVEVARLTASDGAASDRLGGSVAVDGDTIVAGAAAHKVGPNDSQGAAYVFVKPGTGWRNTTQSAELTASDGAASDGFSAAVGISGDTIVAGPAQHTVDGKFRQGEGYVFLESASGWVDGITLASAGNVIAIGGGLHPTDDVAGAGAVYIFGATPQIAIASPLAGSTLTQGTPAVASFNCVPAGNATIANCSGSVANGALIDTSAVGMHTFTVTALDSDGVGANRSVTYNVASAPKPKATAPSITAVRQTAPAWRRGRAPARNPKARRYPVGTTFSFTLYQAATVSLRFALQLPGRKVRGHCVAPSRVNKHSSACTRAVAVGELRFSGHAGRNSVAFQGRISRSRTLRPGPYTMAITATDSAGQRTMARPLRFTIVG